MNSLKNKKLEQFSSLDALSMKAAKFVVNLANEAIAKEGVFSIALAGGSTPKRLYELLSSEEFRLKTDWAAWQVYFSDERLVPINNEQSNYKMARTSLLGNVPINKKTIYIPPVHLNDSKAVATEYEQIVRAHFKEDTPQFDLILLGLGSDGHTASLFPGKSTLSETKQLIVPSPPGALPPPVERITFSLPLINAARNVLFLAAGNDKAPAFQASYNDTPFEGNEHTPAALVQPKNGEVHWFITNELLK